MTKTLKRTGMSDEEIKAQIYNLGLAGKNAKLEEVKKQIRNI